jgi:hypothetical protein
MTQRNRQKPRLNIFKALRDMLHVNNMASSSIVSTSTNQHREANIDLKLDSILIEEYKYASARLLQTLQDRAGTFNLYFLLVGIAASSLGVFYQLGGITKEYSQTLVFILFVALGLLHGFFIGHLMVLEAAHHEYTVKMNAIKNFYAHQFQQQIPTIKQLLFTDVNVNSPLSFNYSLQPTNLHVCLVLSLISCLCFACAAFIGTEIWLHIDAGKLLPLTSDASPYIGGVVIGIITLVLNVIYYFKSAVFRYNFKAPTKI